MSEAEKPERTIRLSNGIVLKVKQFSLALIRRAVAQVAKPQPPKIKPREDRDYEEENPDDPAYKEALEEYEERTIEITVDMMYAMGSEVASVPEGMSSPEDEWTAILDYFHIPFERDNEYARYLDWLKLYAMASPDDVVNVTRAVAETIGLRGEEVDQAVDSFRGGKVGGADNGVPPEAAGDRDHVPPNRAGRRTRNRGKGSG